MAENFHFSEVGVCLMSLQLATHRLLRPPKVPLVSYGKNTSKWDKYSNFVNKFPHINGIRSEMTELERMRTPVKTFFETYKTPKRKWGMQIMSAPMKVVRGDGEGEG